MRSATVNPAKMELTPARVTYKGVDLGGTLSNVKVHMKYGKADIMADQYGKSVLDRVVSSVEATIETELTQTKDKDTWKVVFPNADKVTSGGNSSIIWRSKIGSHDLALAGPLILHPLSLADADLSNDVTAPLAVANEDSELVYGPDQQQRLKIVWNVYLDTGTNPSILLKFGDPALAIVNAVVGAPVFTGTGNGTLTLAAGTATSKTETITAKVVGAAANGGTFAVSGSVSGPLGLAILPGGPGGSVAFVSSVISFTITDGGVDFLLNDQFTLAVTGPNYV